MKEQKNKLILVTGATGYVGGRLVPRLLEAGHRVRLLVRGGTQRLAGRPWQDEVEIIEGDVLKPDTLPPALANVDAAYYLIHSMGGSEKFRQRDHDAACNFSEAAAAAGVEQIIYLGGLGGKDQELSEHLQSRQETGVALRSGGVPVTEFRAGMVVGSGSLSFEMLRSLVERIPVMICPKWAFNKTQPIAIRDVLSYLLAALETPESKGRIIEIGGPTMLTYADIFRRYAKIRNLPRFIIPVPVLSPFLSSYWVHWMTPVPVTIARPLIEGLLNDLVVTEDDAHELFPAIKPIAYETAVELAAKRVDANDIETVWSDARSSSRGDLPPVYLSQEQGMLFERRERLVDAPEKTVFEVFAGIGGRRGWPSYNWLWEIRGILDRAVGGPGMRRGRRHPDKLRVGDALDFWRVEAVEPNELILLHAEMKLPGHGWLRFRATPDAESGKTKLVQTAFFEPHGLLGLLYWYSVYPMHGFVFSSMIESLCHQAETRAQRSAATSPNSQLTAETG
ncbi:MAG: SDR family oxidoreductase [Caldilineaceae bacterium]|nr:SDR family oxidoreductase [Caldilineaceae bacterium]